MALDTMQAAALGRPFSLGMLYDARNDRLLPGLRLWDDEALQGKITNLHKPFSAFEISASDSIESRSSLLNVDASLKASFLGGLIEVGGSAKYLNDKKKFKNQSRVTCQYNATTNFKELSVIHLQTMDTQQLDIIKKSSATHVATGILYGANSFFVFDSEKVDSSSVEDIQGNMEAVIKKIPSFSIEGRVDIKLTDEEKALTNKFSCKFYGDFILENNPTNFEEAVKTYAKLPQLLGKDGENSVPVKVWLMPIKIFDSEAAELKTEISALLVRKVQNTLEELREIEMRCNDSRVDKVAENFPQIQKELSRFQNLCDSYKLKVQQTMAKKLPLIREGKEDESSVEQLFKNGDMSPFSYEKLSKWLDHKEREINIIRSILDSMKEAKIVHSQSELDREVLASGVYHAVCFVFTSLVSDDPGLDVMEDYLDSSKLATTNYDVWYYSDEVITKMREKAEDINNLAEALRKNKHFRFLVADIDNKKYKGATIYHYKKGILVTDDFLKPDIPSVTEITDKSDLLWYSTELTLDPETAHPNLTLSDNNKTVESGKPQHYPDSPERFDMYQQVLCNEGLSGRHYWEVEWSGFFRAGVTYKGITRKSWAEEASLGYSEKSWCFGFFTYPSSEYYHFHNAETVPVKVSFTGFKRLGVYLDWPAGTLSFYKVDTNFVSHIHTFDTKFYEVVYPGFMVGFLDPPQNGQVRFL